MEFQIAVLQDLLADKKFPMTALAELPFGTKEVKERNARRMLNMLGNDSVQESHQFVSFGHIVNNPALKGEASKPS